MSTLLELIEEYRDSHLVGAGLEAANTMTEINRRLSLVDEFHGTEATRMRAILETGVDKAWWQE